MTDTKKLKVYLDVDSTVIDSCEIMALYYNRKYHTGPRWKEAKGENIYYFNGTREMPLMTLQDIHDVFDSDFFWENVKIYDNCIDTLKRLNDSDKFIMSFCSIGTSKNIANKTLFLAEKFPFIKQHEMKIKNFGAETRMGKDKIVQDGLLIDDHQRNLNGSAMYELLFAADGEKDWNRNFKIGKNKAITNNWKDVYHIVNEFYEDWRQKYE